jgi:DNA-binding NarL/FixJ family response regulator
MSNTGVQGRKPLVSDVLAHELVALVAGGSVRDEIAEILEGEALSFKSFADVEALLECRLECTPSVILLWVEDTVSGLLDRIEPLTRPFEHTPTIVICQAIERWGVRTALTAGAAGVVVWTDLPSALGPSVHAVQSGQICVPRAHRRQIEPPALSAREKQILGLVVMGYMNGQIAQQLFLAESTVKSHLSSAFGKLGVHSRNEAVRLILDPERGLGTGILGLGGEPLEPAPTTP